MNVIFSAILIGAVQMILRKLIGEIISLLVTIVRIFIIVFTLNITVFTISEVNQVSMRNTLFEGDIVYYSRLENKPERYYSLAFI